MIHNNPLAAFVAHKVKVHASESVHSPRPRQIADHVRKLIGCHHIGGRVLVGAQAAVRTRDAAQIVAGGVRVARPIECVRIDVAEHDATRHVLVVDGAVLVVGQEFVAVQHGQRHQRRRGGQRHRRWATAAGDVAENVAECVALRVAFGLLETEFGHQLEEVALRLIGAGQVDGAGGGRPRRRQRGHDDGGGDEKQPTGDGMAVLVIGVVAGGFRCSVSCRFDVFFVMTTAVMTTLMRLLCDAP